MNQEHLRHLAALAEALEATLDPARLSLEYRDQLQEKCREAKEYFRKQADNWLRPTMD